MMAAFSIWNLTTFDFARQQAAANRKTQEPARNSQAEWQGLHNDEAGSPREILASRPGLPFTSYYDGFD